MAAESASQQKPNVDVMECTYVRREYVDMLWILRVSMAFRRLLLGRFRKYPRMISWRLNKRQYIAELSSGFSMIQY